MMDQKQTLEPPVPVDEGWWESVLAEEQRAAVFSPRLPKPGARRRAALDAPKNREVERRSERAAKSAAPADKPSADWPHIRRLFHADEIVRLAVTGSNRGGLLVEGDGLFGFVPFSHLIELSGSEPADRDKALGAYVGRTLQLKVIECVPEDGRVVFSERAAQAEPGRRSRIFDTLQPGQTARGIVTNITDFGVFVDLGGVEGLVHISELSWGRVAHPNQIVKLGEELETLVLGISAERCRVALSLKRLFPNPWLSIERDLGVDQVVPATVTAVLSYGAFARLDMGVEGLIHASEIPRADGCAIKDFLSAGQRVQVRVLHVDAARQRMGLSLRLETPQTA
ncbi:MAG: hypothetical protein JETCAE02_26570 [Anaerolineaceae bacterium]|nr:S1 RNA-binding domain-containing protein [Anaerolineae bacterium]MBL1171452.1 S1 RNA-binding domain-containing protein [Chloroflexota bacterium]MDL1926121.1 S1 RNA-binding domain-containing protein [Anaerolineae bacterium AMX1]GJQ40245.1 MAG: hypothetical protein JETCAE02_26570 [Anaerolineaceae bacterium]